MHLLQMVPSSRRLLSDSKRALAAHLCQHGHGHWGVPSRQVLQLSSIDGCRVNAAGQRRIRQHREQQHRGGQGKGGQLQVCEGEQAWQVAPTVGSLKKPWDCCKQ